MHAEVEHADVDTCLADINKIFEEKGQGPHMLLIDFEPVTVGPVEYVSDRTGKNTTRWTWRHKFTGVVVNRYPTRSGKSWDTGVLSHYLQTLHKSKDKVTSERAQHILQLNCKKSMKASLNRDVASEKMVLKREDVLKQWVSHSFMCCFSFSL